MTWHTPHHNHYGQWYSHFYHVGIHMACDMVALMGPMWQMKLRWKTMWQSFPTIHSTRVTSTRLPNDPHYYKSWLFKRFKLTNLSFSLKAKGLNDTRTFWLINLTIVINLTKYTTRNLVVCNQSLCNCV